MPYWRLFYHFIWTSKGRLPVIEAGWMPHLHGVIAAKAQQLGAFVYAVGGTEDHVHLAAAIPPTIGLAQFAGQVKGSSSHWVNRTVAPEVHFAWQEEYGVVSFGAKQLDFVVTYIKNQREHHRNGATITSMECTDPEDRPVPNP